MKHLFPRLVSKSWNDLIHSSKSVFSHPKTFFLHFFIFHFEGIFFRHCFIENLHQTAAISPLEYAVLCGWYEYLAKKRQVAPDLLIYLRTCPEILLDRIKSRGRLEEQNIHIEYLTNLHQLHEHWVCFFASLFTKSTELHFLIDEDDIFVTFLKSIFSENIPD